jgi:2-phospho-L-lactate guanylyltransferase
VSVIVPVKPLGVALGRLRTALGPRERRELQVAMLTDLLDAVAASRGVGEILLVSADPVARRMGAGRGARVLDDHAPPRGMNAAVSLGLGAARARAALVLVADLPLARPPEIEALLRARPRGRGPHALIAPSRQGTGTNALLLTPPGALTPEFGVGSLARHRAQAAARGVPLTLCPQPGLGLDVDVPADLADLRAAPGLAGATAAVLARQLSGVPT